MSTFKELEKKVEELEEKLEKPEEPEIFQPLEFPETEVVPRDDWRIIRQAKLGIPKQTTVPTDTPQEGELRLFDDGTDFRLYTFLTSAWRKLGDSAFLANIVEDTTPQLGGDLDLNGKNLDFPTTANISDVLDEDNMASDSATVLATQQSIKKYVDDSFAVTAGDNLLQRADTERSTSSNSFVKAKEISVAMGGTYRILFDMKHTLASQGAEGQIFKNGVAFGTLRATSSTTYVNFTEDLVFAAGDLIQLFHRVPGSGEVQTRNFILNVSKAQETQVLQD